MEQKSSKFGVFVATLAMIASVLVMPTVSAQDGDLVASLTGDVGSTSYSSELGNATFDLTITSASGIAHHNVNVTVTFRDSSTQREWNEHYATISDCVGDGTTAGNVIGNLSEGDTMNACISVSVELSGGEASKEQVSIVVSVTSDEDTTGHVVEGLIQLVNWYASNNDGTKAFQESNDEGDCTSRPNCHTYTISVKNIKVDLDGNDQSTDEKITITLPPSIVGWKLNSSTTATYAWEWQDGGKVTINGLDEGQIIDVLFELNLEGGNVAATSYEAEDYSQVNLQVSDDNGFYSFVTIYATVADNFAVLVDGSFETLTVDNGCTDDDAIVTWDVSVKNHGNTWDTFSISFDLADTEEVGWDVNSEGGLPTTTGTLDRKIAVGGKFNPGSMLSFTLEMTIPGGLDAGMSKGFTMTVVSEADDTVTSTSSFAATVDQCYGIALDVDKSSAFANPGSVATFALTVTNNGNGQDTITFGTMGPATWSPMVTMNSITLARDTSDDSSVKFTVTVPEDAGAGENQLMLMVHAYSEACEVQNADCEYEAHKSVSVTANQIYSITADYYTNETGVVKKSAEIEEGQQVQMFITLSNQGNGGDRVTLELLDAPAWVVLDKDSQTLSTTKPADIAIDVRAPASDATGDHTFRVKATSQDPSGNTTSTTGTLTITVVEKSTGSGSSTETVDEDEGLPGFGAISALAALGVALILRRRL